MVKDNIEFLAGLFLLGASVALLVMLLVLWNNTVMFYEYNKYILGAEMGLMVLGVILGWYVVFKTMK